MYKILMMFIAMTLFWGCNGNGNKSDAFGNFETDEVIVSSESFGKISDLTITEGAPVQKGQLLAMIDTVQLHIQKSQILAAIGAISSKTQDVQVQINVLQERKNNLLREKKRIESLLADGAATQKQLDDMNGEIEVVERNMVATRTSMNTGNQGLLSEIKPQQEQLKLIEDKLVKCRILSPIDGYILVKYVENNEFATQGKPLFKVADTKNMYLKAFVSGDQLAEVKIGSKVKVLIDNGKKDYYTYDGVITWVSEKAEFTPKVIQTKEERTNLVYAFKVQVVNDGRIKIGMPGEIRFK
jgi:HlyD family secretion protein